jgi:thiol-disulfide isomerase/thioredoxin
VSVGAQRSAAGRLDAPPHPSRRKYVLLFVALFTLAVGAVVVAARSDPTKVAAPLDVHNLPVGPSAPSLTAAKGWLNSPALPPAALRGKVVLYDFWTYSCVNCVRAVPHVRSWYDRYAKDGLVVVGIHSPEFDFEKNHANVQAAVKRLHVDYPVALDDNMAIWNEFANQYWPADYIADRHGHLRASTIGEGSYTQTENVLRALLGIRASAPRAGAVNEGKIGTPPTATDDITPETYLGLQRGIAGAQAGVVDYPPVTTLTRDRPALAGRWLGDDQDVVSSASGAAIVIRYRAREANLVMATAAPGGAPVEVRVELDGRPLPPADRTPDTLVDANGHTFIRVQASDLYRLVLGRSIQTHTLRLTAESPNVEAFAFTFSA